MDPNDFSAAVVDIVRAFLERELDPVLAQVKELTLRVDAWSAPRDGKDADPTAVAAIVAGDIRKDIAGLQASVNAIKPAPELPDIPALISAALPPIPTADQVKAMVTAEFAALPRFDEQKAMGELRADMATAIELEVVKRVAALPVAKDGVDGKDGMDITLADIEPMVRHQIELSFEKIPTPQDGKSVTAEELAPLIEDRVQKAVSAIPVPKDGKDGLGVASAMIDRAGNLVLTASDGTTKELGRVVGADGRDGTNGKDGAPGERGIDGMHGKDGAAGLDGKDGRDAIDGKDGLPGAHGKDGLDGANGKDGDAGRDGKDAEPVTKDQIIEAIRSIDAIPVAVQQWLEANPPAAGKDGVDGKDGRDGVDGIKGVDGLNGKDGADGSDGAPGREGVDGKHGEKGLDGAPGRDGVDVADLLVVENGDVVATFTDGRTKLLGPFRGKDGDPGKDGADGKDGRDGVDGLGFEDMVEEMADDGRTLIRRYMRDGKVVKEFRHTMAIVLDRGVFKSGQAYFPGDGVTFKGSFFIAQKETTDPPEKEGGSWRLAVKRGQNGNDGKDGGSGPLPSVKIGKPDKAD